MLRLMKLVALVNEVSPYWAFRLMYLHNHPLQRDARFLDLFWPLIKEGRMLLTIREAYNLYHYLPQTLPLGGAVAELGSYRGGSAKLLGALKGDRPLHLFDTFGGMPATQPIDVHRPGDLGDTSLASVQAYLRDVPNVHFHPGVFPETARDLPADIAFCFVHLDADLYQSTLAGLRYFWPRLQPGGVLLAHDYEALSCPGVRQAFDEYFTGETVTPLWDSHTMVRRPIGPAAP